MNQPKHWTHQNIEPTKTLNQEIVFVTIFNCLRFVSETQETDRDTECSQDELIKSLEEKVTALSTALQSMTEGKNKMEIVYQADKKAVLVRTRK